MDHRDRSRVWLRRDVLRGAGLLGATAAMPGFLASCGRTEQTPTHPDVATYTDEPHGALRYMCWESFADDSIVKPYERRGVDIAATYFGSLDEMFGKLRAGGGSGFDAINTASDVVIPLARAGLLAPIDIDSLPHYEELRPQLRRSPLWEHQGRQYAVPLNWGSTVLLADTRRLGKLDATLPFEMLFEPRFRGRVTAMDDLSVIMTTAVYRGYGNFWDLTDEQLAEIQNLLIDELLPNVRKFSATFSDQANLFANQEVDLAWGWTGVIRQALIAAGQHHVTEHQISPAMPWYVDTISAVAASRNLDTVANWIDYNLMPEVAANRFKANALPTAVPGAARYLSPELQAASYLTPELNSFWENLDPELQWHPVKKRSLYQAVWNSVKAGTKQFPG